MNYEFHEVANIFPMMTDSEYDGLVEDIKKNGQIDPIWIYQGKIIDGRNRYNACQRLSIEPIVKEWDGKGSLVDFVISKNLHRRQLTATQRIQALTKADGLKEAEREAARERMISSLKQNTATSEPKERTNKGETVEKLGEIFGVGPTSIYAYNRVKREGSPELIEAMDKEKVSIDKASKIVKLPKEEQAEVINKILHNEPADIKPYRLKCVPIPTTVSSTLKW